MGGLLSNESTAETSDCEPKGQLETSFAVITGGSVQIGKLKELAEGSLSSHIFFSNFS